MDNLLLEFIQTKMTKAQLKQALKLFNDEDKLLYFIICSYNCYKVLHSNVSLGRMSLITNPEALMQTFATQKAYMDIIKEFIYHRLDITPPQEDTINERCANHRTPENIIKD